MSERQILGTIKDYAHASSLAAKAGYDGVEIMGSEGYLINQFACIRTNQRTDDWGGSIENRMRLAIETIKAVREKVGEKFIIIFRLSMLDLVEGGNTWEEVVTMAKAVEQAGATLINTGIGWHEARVPTIVTSVPRAAFTWVTERMKKEVSIPLITTNRINTPEVAEEVLASGQADMVSMARPFLADADFVNKAAANKSDEINTCIGCNQACLVNPRACYETELNFDQAKQAKKIAVIGAGPAGLAFSVYATERGHKVELFDKISEIGGQFNVAKQIPGKEEFYETLRYFNKQLALHNIPVHLNSEQNADNLLAAGFDEVVLATGIKPRRLDIEGFDHPKVLSYLEVLRDKVAVGKKVAIIGAGGIGFDVASYLAESGAEIHAETGGSLTTNRDAWLENWGVDKTYQHSGALNNDKLFEKVETSRQITLLQRKTSKVGKGLGKTSGWVHRANLVKHGVNMVPGVTYKSISDAGLLIEVNDTEQLLEVDNVIICAGQESNRDLQQALEKGGVNVHLIGGANVAAELDAKRAIRQAAELAMVI